MLTRAIISNIPIILGKHKAEWELRPKGSLLRRRSIGESCQSPYIECRSQLIIFAFLMTDLQVLNRVSRVVSGGVSLWIIGVLEVFWTR